MKRETHIPITQPNISKPMNNNDVITALQALKTKLETTIQQFENNTHNMRVTFRELSRNMSSR